MKGLPGATVLGCPPVAPHSGHPGAPDVYWGTLGGIVLVFLFRSAGAGRADVKMMTTNKREGPGR